MIDTYILEGHTPVQEPDLMKWERWFETAERRVALTEKNGIRLLHYLSKRFEPVRISTVFLGINHQFFGEGKPLLFETMVFGGPFDGQIEQCSTWEQAERQHKEMVEKALPTACL